MERRRKFRARTFAFYRLLYGYAHSAWDRDAIVFVGCVALYLIGKILGVPI